MRRSFTTIAFGFVMAVVAMTGEMTSQRIDTIGQQVIAGPHLPVIPVTYN